LAQKTTQRARTSYQLAYDNLPAAAVATTIESWRGDFSSGMENRKPKKL